jgi:hypothetical protein
MKHLIQTVTAARDDLAHVRQLQQRHRADMAADHEGRTNEWIADRNRKKAAEVVQAVKDRLVQRNTLPTLAAVLDTRDQWSKATLLRQAPWHSGGGVPYDVGPAAEIANNALLRILVKETKALRWEAKVRTMNVAELRRGFTEALATGEHAIAGCILAEAERQAAANKAAVNRLSDDELKATADVRALPHELNERLEQVPMSEADQAAALLNEATALSSWIQSAVQSFTTSDLDDPGERAERLFRFRQQHPDATNDDVREHLATAAAA